MLHLPLRLALAAQCAYYVFGGLWPLLHYRSFEAVTGPKRDAWLVKTVAGMMLAVAATLGRALWRPEPPPPAVRHSAIGAALALAWSGTWYSLRGRISRLYLLDAGTQATLAVAVLLARDQRTAATEESNIEVTRGR